MIRLFSPTYDLCYSRVSHMYGSTKTRFSRAVHDAWMNRGRTLSVRLILFALLIAPALCNANNAASFAEVNVATIDLLAIQKAGNLTHRGGTCPVSAMLAEDISSVTAYPAAFWHWASEAEAFSALSSRRQRERLGVGSRINFTENKGQWDDRVAFRSIMKTATLFLEQDCFTIVLQHPDNDNLKHFPADFNQKGRYREHVYRVHFVGSHAAGINGEQQMNGYENFFIGNDPGRWARNVLSYQTVHYQQLYDGVDLKVYSAENALKYDFIVEPHADASQIVMRYEGLNDARLQNGNLLLKTSVVDVVELKPYAYQLIGGKEVEVSAEYVLKGEEVRFALGSYDHSQPLIIDPYLVFSTYTGSSADNWGTTGAYDSYKHVYTSGLVFGAGYPISSGAYDGSYNGNADVGIFKFDTSGQQRLWATYLGGQYADMPHSMFVNSLDELLILGTTGSANFPTTPNAYSTTFGGGTALQYEGSSIINFPNGVDMFVVRFSADGTQLLASTYLGGSGNDGLNYFQHFNNDFSVVMDGNDSLYHNYGDGARGELITDDLNNVYVGSTTVSFDFPTTAGCPQPTSGGGQEGIALKLDYNLSHLLWSTYFGGSGADAIYSIDVDSEYNVLVAGGTNSSNLPVTSGCYKPVFGGGTADGFVAKIDRYGTLLMNSTYYGSPAYDQCYFVRCGKYDDVFLFGQTRASGSTLVHNATYNTPGGGQMLARLNSSLDSLVWGTVFGSGRNEIDLSPTAFSADICNRIYLCGWGRYWGGYRIRGQNVSWYAHGTKGLAVTSDAYQDSTDGQDFYFMSLSDDASQLVYATYFGELHNTDSAIRGNDHVDGGTSRFDRLGTLYQSVCASCGGNTSFPTTTSAWSRVNNANNCNNAIFSFSVNEDFPVAEFVVPPVGCGPQTIQFHNTGRGNSFLWSFGDGTTSTQKNPTHTFSAGTYIVTLVAYMTDGCRTTDTFSREIVVLGSPRHSLDTLATCPGLHLQIGTQAALGCTYRWIMGAVSDSSISNPYVENPGTYTLVISNGACSDTVDQVVQEGAVDVKIFGDTSACFSPMTFRASSSAQVTGYLWSDASVAGDTLCVTPQFRFPIQHSQWLYLLVTDRLGCHGKDSVYIHFYSICDSLVLGAPLCPDSCSGTASCIITSYAQRPVQYNWGHGFVPDSTVGNLCPGTYHLILRDANGCGITKSFVLVNPPHPMVADSIVHVRCLEENTGEIHLSIIGSGTYTLQWQDDGSTSCVRTGLAPGVYNVVVTDSNGCQYPYSYTVLENANMRVEATLVSNTCLGDCSGSATAVVNGGLEPYTYLWSNGYEGVTADNLCQGVVVVIATDSAGCSVRDTVHVGVQHSFDSVEAWADDSVVFATEATILHATSIPNGSYSWQPITGVFSPHDSVTVAVVMDTTVYYVTFTDSVGCTHVDSVRVCGVYVDCSETNIFIPNVFTPNGDGVNDRLCFSGEWVTDFYIAIFSRWGELLYESHDINECWDGRHKDNWCQPGVYTYTCRVKCEANQETEIKGDVTIVR